ncbi:MAG: SpvB/TcaC N-terminal domain-containing protein [Acidobacteriota bacterium]
MPNREEGGPSGAGAGKGQATLSPPAISLPKGGGAIRVIGEKFTANPVTGTGSMTVPVATSPGRNGFGPELSLSYDSGSGNGPFGFGWSLALPSVTRKTDKGLPRYFDAAESDVFILSGSEDLVPLLAPGGGRFEDDTTAPGYTIHRYRPRVEGTFARVERWTRDDDPADVHWRSISKDNLLTLYGKDANSRVFDPEDPLRIFTWLICETRDEKGNALLYEYKAEDGAGVDLSLAHERNRGGLEDPRRAANRYLKRVRYGNRTPLLDNAGRRPRFLTDAQTENAGWMFEVVFDYGEHDADAPAPDDASQWGYRADPFSTYRAGFEVRTGRLCQRVLMFHDFPDEADVGGDCLVRSTDFTYSHEQDPADARNPVYTFLRAVTQSGYRRQNVGYLKRSLPPVEFEYSQPVVQEEVREVDAESLENLPVGLDGSAYQWIDLHGEGVPGILAEQAGAWFYKRNLSPVNLKIEEGAQRAEAKFAPVELVSAKPNLSLADGRAQFMDLAGDGQPDLVIFEGPGAGLYEHDGDEGWQPFRPFTSRLERDTRDPNLKFIDLDGDGHADVLVTEGDAFVWHPAKAEEGFGPARRVHQALDEEKGPRVVFADAAQSIHLADISGDGLTDLVRIRNGEVCYWPNLGYGRFGAKVTMDDAPRFDSPDQFDPGRIRLADIDGSGTNDIIYLHREGVRLYFNQSGNGWSAPQPLKVFPRVDDLATINVTDLLGNGTACLVWSSPLPFDARRQMRYVDLLGGRKPHLLVRVVNNLGAETLVEYASSAKFYLQDKRDGRPWVTRLPFPVHVVERVQTNDRVGGNRFVTRYAYHHGYFDGVEREFRGFGMVEQTDTEEFASLSAGDAFPSASNVEEASHVPPLLTRTWFHTGAYLGRDHVSDFFAGLLDGDDKGEYYREPGLSDDEARAQLLEDTLLPAGLLLEEEREACRALKGSMLRQEVYALDGTGTPDYPVGHPYTVTEQNFNVRLLQTRAGNRHAVFFTHAREALRYDYERDPTDPRVQHALTLEVDEFGNVLTSAAVGYGRRQPDLSLPAEDRAKQTQTLITYTAGGVTISHDTGAAAIDDAVDYRTPLPFETRTYELTGLALPPGRSRFTPDEISNGGAGALPIPYHQQSPAPNVLQKRLIEHVRTLYRRDNLAGALPPGEVQSLALPFESYKLAFTPGLLAGVYGVRVTDALLGDEGRYVHSAGDANWWIPAGRVFYSPGTADTAAQELAYARAHFFLPHRYRDPFHTDALPTETFVTYDAHDLLMSETRDALGNRITVGERDADGNLTTAGNDYRVLRPRLVMDANRNRTAVLFDALGMLAGTAMMGKPEEIPAPGDNLSAPFNPDLTQAEIDQFFADPKGAVATALLGGATTRIIYDLTRYGREPDPQQKSPAFAATLARETHAADQVPPGGLKIQVSLSYSDGLGREVQKKAQAEPGLAPARDAGGEIIVGPDGQPQLTPGDVTPRWVGSGWTVFNNKGQPVRQYEPFFTDTHRFEFDARIGVSPILCYDPVGRVVATLHPNHTWEKVVFTPWEQESWDVNDTVLIADPENDADVGEFFSRLPDAAYLPTWHAQRQGGALGPREQAAAARAAAHAGTPARSCFDTLGRTFLNVARNRVVCPGHDLDGTEDEFHTRFELDIEGNRRAARDAVEQNGDARGRVVMRYDYDMLGTRIHQSGMEAGERWMLNDVAGKPLYAWDSRGQRLRTAYDQLRRPVEVRLREGAAPDELVVGRTVHGETEPDPEARNLREKVVRLFDQAGVLNTDVYDFKGNLLNSRRRLAVDYKVTLNWSAAVPLEDETFTTETAYDALNRPVELVAPRSDLPGAEVNVILPTYNEASLLERVEAQLGGAAVATTFIDDIDYDARGQRTLIDYGNGVRTTYEYDPLTFRLTRLLTLRDAAGFPDDCPQPPPAGWPGCQVQNLRYTYDPAGNVTHVTDDAQQRVYFRNRRVEPSASYTYDAVYRLIEATGREHLGQVGGAPVAHSHDDVPRVGVDWSANDGNALGTYVERYVYDAAGNFLRTRHRGTDPAQPGWTREYAYGEASLLEPLKRGNRLSATSVVSNDPLVVEPYTHDAHGNMTTMPHLSLMQWDYGDRLRATSRQVVNAGTPETTWYVYDDGGRRVRKVTERQNGTRRNERIYLDGFEVYREYDGGGDTVTLERETLHLMDDKQRVALVESRTRGDDPGPAQLIRYQLGNHLGSSSLELDQQAQIISYEEYTPYGSTSYQAVRSQTETPKRYRFIGKERDEESGLYYHGARYYAPWLGRWTSCDAADISDGLNVYAYGRDNPVNNVDKDGSANQPIHDDLTKLVALQYTDSETAAQIGLAANLPDTKDDLKSVPNSAKGDPSNINRDVHVLWHGSREKKVEITLKNYRTRNPDGKNQDEQITDAGVNLLHPLQDANYHVADHTFGPGIGHALNPEIDLAVGEKSFKEFYQVVKDTETGIELMREKGVLGDNNDPSINKISEKQWEGIYNDLKAIENNYSTDFTFSKIVGAGSILGLFAGTIAGAVIGAGIAFLTGLGGFLVEGFTGGNSLERIETAVTKAFDITFNSVQSILGVGVGNVLGLAQPAERDRLRDVIAEKQSAYMQGKIAEIQKNNQIQTDMNKK